MSNSIALSRVKVRKKRRKPPPPMFWFWFLNVIWDLCFAVYDLVVMDLVFAAVMCAFLCWSWHGFKREWDRWRSDDS